MRSCTSQQTVRRYLLDGFPRTLAQAKAITDANLEVCVVCVCLNVVQVNHFVFLDVPDALIVKRIAGRVIDPVSGRCPCCS